MRIIPAARTCGEYASRSARDRPQRVRARHTRPRRPRPITAKNRNTRIDVARARVDHLLPVLAALDERDPHQRGADHAREQADDHGAERPDPSVNHRSPPPSGRSCGPCPTPRRRDRGTRATRPRCGGGVRAARRRGPRRPPAGTSTSAMSATTVSSRLDSSSSAPMQRSHAATWRPTACRLAALQPVLQSGRRSDGDRRGSLPSLQCSFQLLTRAEQGASSRSGGAGPSRRRCPRSSCRRSLAARSSVRESWSR